MDQQIRECRKLFQRSCYFCKNEETAYVIVPLFLCSNDVFKQRCDFHLSHCLDCVRVFYSSIRKWCNILNPFSLCITERCTCSVHKKTIKELYARKTSQKYTEEQAQAKRGEVVDALLALIEGWERDRIRKGAKNGNSVTAREALEFSLFLEEREVYESIGALLMQNDEIMQNTELCFDFLVEMLFRNDGTSNFARKRLKSLNGVIPRGSRDKVHAKFNAKIDKGGYHEAITWAYLFPGLLDDVQTNSALCLLKHYARDSNKNCFVSDSNNIYPRDKSKNCIDNEEYFNAVHIFICRLVCKNGLKLKDEAVSLNFFDKCILYLEKTEEIVGLLNEDIFNVMKLFEKTVFIKRSKRVLPLFLSRLCLNERIRKDCLNIINGVYESSLEHLDDVMTAYVEVARDVPNLLEPYCKSVCRRIVMLLVYQKEDERNGLGLLVKNALKIVKTKPSRYAELFSDLNYLFSRKSYETINDKNSCLGLQELHDVLDAALPDFPYKLELNKMGNSKKETDLLIKVLRKSKVYQKRMSVLPSKFDNFISFLYVNLDRGGIDDVYGVLCTTIELLIACSTTEKEKNKEKQKKSGLDLDVSSFSLVLSKSTQSLALLLNKLFLKLKDSDLKKFKNNEFLTLLKSANEKLSEVYSLLNGTCNDVLKMLNCDSKDEKSHYADFDYKNVFSSLISKTEKVCGSKREGKATSVVEGTTVEEEPILVVEPAWIEKNAEAVDESLVHCERRRGIDFFYRAVFGKEEVSPLARRIPDSFASVEEYIDCYLPFVISEAKATITYKDVNEGCYNALLLQRIEEKNNTKLYVFVENSPYAVGDVLFIQHKDKRTTGVVHEQAFSLYGVYCYRECSLYTATELKVSIKNYESFQILASAIERNKDKYTECKTKLIGNLTTGRREYTSLVSASTQKITQFISDPIQIPFSYCRLKRDSILHTKECACNDKTKSASECSTSVLNNALAKNEHYNMLNDSQKNAIVHVFLNPNKFSLVQGPPGTGKTTMIVSLVISLLVGAKCKVLVTAPSNAAVDELLRKIGKQVPNDVSLIRIGTEKFIAKDLAHYGVQFAAESLCEGDRSYYRLRKGLIENADVVFSTLNTCEHLLKENVRFDFLIIDECCQAVETSTLIALLCDVEKILLVGDPKQLPPTVISNAIAYERTFFERLSATHDVYMLKVQYRMNNSICRFISKSFYDSHLLTSETVGRRRRWLETMNECSFVNVHGAQERNKQSLFNTAESRFIVDFIQWLVKTHKNENFMGRIGVIAMYREQVGYLKQAIVEASNLKRLVEVNTVDGFQGQEKDVVIVSCVRSDSRVGFLRDERRMNVAITRAKSMLLVVGSAQTLMMDRRWRTFIKYCQERNAYYESSVFMEKMNKRDGLV